MSQFIPTISNFTTCGLHNKHKFLQNSTLLLRSWINILKECNTDESNEKIMSECKQFISKFIAKTLKNITAEISRQNPVENENLDLSDYDDEREYKGIANIFNELGSLSSYSAGSLILESMHSSLVSDCQKYIEGMKTHNISDPKDFECRLGWLINLLSAFLIIKGMSSLSCNFDKKETECCFIAFQLIDFAIKLYNEQKYIVDEYLELAFIKFCGSFKKDALLVNYGESHSSLWDNEDLNGAYGEGYAENPYTDIENLVRQANLGGICDLLFTKLLTNLTFYSDNHKIIELTLAALKDLVSEHSTTKKLWNFPIIQSLIKNHIVFLHNSK